jgi:hypothetical protein
VNYYHTIELTHANTQKPLRIVVGTGLPFGWYEPAKANVVFTAAGIFPVKETLEEISKKIDSINSPTGQENKNG